MAVALGRLAAEDPSFRVVSNVETGQTIIKGMGELHLEVLVDACVGNLRWRPMWARLRWPIKRPSRSLGPVITRTKRWCGTVCTHQPYF